VPSRRLHLLGVRKRNEVDVHSFAFPRSENESLLETLRDDRVVVHLGQQGQSFRNLLPPNTKFLLKRKIWLTR